VWNDAGAFLDFHVAPAYYQTMWFRLSCVAAFLALLAALYQLRLRQLARQFNCLFSPVAPAALQRAGKINGGVFDAPAKEFI
jgi:hypothetical protein